MNESIAQLVKEARESVSHIPESAQVDFDAVVPMLYKIGQDAPQKGGILPDPAFYERTAAGPGRTEERAGGGRLINPYSGGAAALTGILGALFGGIAGGGKGAIFGGLLSGLLGFLAQKMGFFPPSLMSVMDDVFDKFMPGDEKAKADAKDKIKDKAAQGFAKLTPEGQKEVLAKVDAAAKATGVSPEDILPGGRLGPEAPTAPTVAGGPLAAAGTAAAPKEPETAAETAAKEELLPPFLRKNWNLLQDCLKMSLPVSLHRKRGPG